MLEFGSGNLGSVNESRAHGSNLHCNLFAAVSVKFFIKFDNNADLAVVMDIRSTVAFDSYKSSDVHVFTDNKNHFFSLVFNGTVKTGVSTSHKSVKVSRIFFCNNFRNGVCESGELFVLCNEVGLGVNFNHSGNVSAVVYCDRAFGSDSVCFFVSSRKTLLAEKSYSLFHIALCLYESFFALHQTNAGSLSEFVDLFGGNSNCHNI